MHSMVNRYKHTLFHIDQQWWWRCDVRFFFLFLSPSLSVSLFLFLCGFFVSLILFIIEKSSNKNHIFSHTFGYYCRIYFDKQLIYMSNKLWRLHASNTQPTRTARYKYQTIISRTHKNQCTKWVSLHLYCFRQYSRMYRLIRRNEMNEF